MFSHRCSRRQQSSRPLPPGDELDQTTPSDVRLVSPPGELDEPELHNVLRCRQKTEPQPQVTRTENLAKFGRVVFKIRERTYRQTNKQTY